jgi:hypothetical protein
MTADQPELSADEVLIELRNSGITTRLDLQNMIAAARRAERAPDDAETERRRRPRALIGLTPDFMNEDTPRKWAELGELNAWKVGGRWYSCIAFMEEWLIRTDRFPSREAEERWRATMARRFP